MQSAIFLKYQSNRTIITLQKGTIFELCPQQYWTLSRRSTDQTAILFSQQSSTNSQSEWLDKCSFDLKLYKEWMIFCNNGLMMCSVSNVRWWLMPTRQMRLRALSSAMRCQIKTGPSVSGNGHQSCRLASHTSFGIPGLETDEGDVGHTPIFSQSVLVRFYLSFVYVKRTPKNFSLTA